MVVRTQSGNPYDTEKVLPSPERHILQKLIFWETMAVSLEQFGQKVKKAFLKDWNSSSPVMEGTALKTIVSDMEEKMLARLKGKNIIP